MAHSGKTFDWFCDTYLTKAEGYWCEYCWQFVTPADKVAHVESDLEKMDAEDVDREIDRMEQGL